MEITVLYLKISRHQLSIWWSQIFIYSICDHQISNWCREISQCSLGFGNKWSNLCKSVSLKLRIIYLLGIEIGSATYGQKNENFDIMVHFLWTKYFCSIVDLMVANIHLLNLRPSNLQLMPWDFQKQYSYLLSNKILLIQSIMYTFTHSYFLNCNFFIFYLFAWYWNRISYIWSEKWKFWYNGSLFVDKIFLPFFWG
jgi:hypothetical protein